MCDPSPEPAQECFVDLTQCTEMELATDTPATTLQMPEETDTPATTSHIQEETDTIPTQKAPLKRRRTSDSRKFTARSHGAVKNAKSICMIATEPAPGEECVISLCPMAEFRLDFISQNDQHCLFKDSPALTKASLPCGHSFSAMALLYHFAKNSMSCPCCRAGHTERMGEQSIPAHLRRSFAHQLAKAREEERRERLLEDSAAVANILSEEVNVFLETFVETSRLYLIIYAYENMSSITPLICLDLPLSCSPRPGIPTLEFTSSGFCVRQLAINLRTIQPRPAAFEAVIVATRDVFGASVQLFRSERFEIGSLGQGGLVPCHQGGEGSGIRVECLHLRDDPCFGRFSWTAHSDELRAALTRGHPAQDSLMVMDL